MCPRLWWVIGVTAALAACSEAAASRVEPAAVPDSVAVQLGPMPTRPTVAGAAVTSTAPAGHGAPTERPATSTQTVAATTTTVTAASTTTTLPKVKVATSKTSCTRVAYIGDSVSLGLVVSEAVPEPPARLDLRLAEIGVVELRAEVSGGRSIVETLQGQENAYDVAVRLRNEGFTGCWIIAVGTNDAANIAAGGQRQAPQRITSLMSVLGTDPVLWLDTATIAESGFWAGPNMQAWNDVLLTMAPAYPQLRIAPWSSFVGTSWYQPDGVHLTDPGSVARAQFVASVLVANFPLRK